MISHEQYGDTFFFFCFFTVQSMATGAVHWVEFLKSRMGGAFKKNVTTAHSNNVLSRYWVKYPFKRLAVRYLSLDVKAVPLRSSKCVVNTVALRL